MSYDDKVYIVTWYNDGERPHARAFKNREAAEQEKFCLVSRYDHVYINESLLYSAVIIAREGQR